MNKTMNKIDMVIYENGTSGMTDENGNNLMEVGETVIQLKSLTNMSHYLQHQVNNSNKNDNVDGDKEDDGKTTKLSYTDYFAIEKYNFISHMMAKCPKKAASIARKYSIHERTAQRW
ncbi:unnamed protein product [Cunninghamella echinulata]